MSQKGFAHYLILIVILMGIAIGLYLIKSPQIFNPQADEPAINSVPVYRLYSDQQNAWFWTEKQSVIDALVQTGGYRNEGVLFYGYSPNNPPAGTVPVYHLSRLADPFVQHFFTINTQEVALLLQLGGVPNSFEQYYVVPGGGFSTDGDRQSGWVLERPTFYAYPPTANNVSGVVPLYRLKYNDPNSVYNGIRYFSSNQEEIKSLLDSGSYINEGIAFFGYNPTPAAVQPVGQLSFESLFYNLDAPKTSCQGTTPTITFTWTPGKYAPDAPFQNNPHASYIMVKDGNWAGAAYLGNGHSYTDSSLNSGEAHNYALYVDDRTFQTAQQSVQFDSNSVKPTPVTVTAPTCAPANFQISPPQISCETQTSPAIFLSWSKYPNAADYRIYYKDSQTGQEGLLTNTNGESAFNVRTLVAGRSYGFAVRTEMGVRGVTTGGNEWTHETYGWAEFPNCKVPQPPQNLTVSSKGCNQSKPAVTLTWTRTDNTLTYGVFRRLDAPNNYKIVAVDIPVDTTTFTDNTVGELPANSTTYYRVLAKNIRGYSQTSNDVPVVVPECNVAQPPVPSPSQSSDGQQRKGDINNDSKVDIYDISKFLLHFGKGSSYCADFNGNMTDEQKETDRSDINGSCKVDIFDFNLLIQNFGK